MKQRIFDFHTHVFPPEIAVKVTAHLSGYYKMPVLCDGTLEGLKKSKREGGVEYSVTFSTATKPTQVESINNYISSISGDGIYGFGTIHPDYPDIEKEIDRIISLGLRGIKLHADFQQFDIDSPKMDRIYAAIEGRLPVLMHAGDKNFDYSHPRRIANVLDRFPKLTIIAAHLGGYMHWPEVREYLMGRNLYFDTSSSLMFLPKKDAVDLILRHGTDKILFATDYPMITHKLELERFYSLGLTDRENEDILFNNAVRLLKLDI